ncbi:hypothetical protein ACLVWQ_19585 [Streptomyces sp. CWNU-52B]|uniref:hypothetical protein n=1 Tax=unclassified Streptomyces TaxID=2593676 RepID=UPI0039C1FF71
MGEREGDAARPNHRTAPSAPSADSAASGHSGPAGQADQGDPGDQGGDPLFEVPPALGALLAATGRGAAVDPGGEKRALAAFREARDAGAHGAAARSRRGDDWRPEAQRRRGRPVRATLIALAASVTLGGVALAAIGSGPGSGPDDDRHERDRPRPSSSAPADTGPGAPGPSGPFGPGRPDGSATASGGPPGRPSTAQDTVAHCRAYDSVKGRGKALNSTAWQRLIRAAGGEDGVEAYCAGVLARAAEAKEKKNADKAEPATSAKPSKTQGNGSTKNPKSAKNPKSTAGAKNPKNTKVPKSR